MLETVRQTDGLDVAGADSARITPISITDLSYVSSEQKLLDGVTLNIPSATRTVIMGANGAGKSLLLRILHGLIVPTGGKVLWNGAVANAAIELKQAMVFQRPVLLRRSAVDNIAFVLKTIAKSKRVARARAILDKANLSHISDTPARLLSGGEQQRLAIARAMAQRPEVLFLDEPTSGLDPASTFAVEKLIDTAFAKGTKIVLVTHDLGQARRIADDIAFLHRGRLVETGNADKFLSGPKSRSAQAYLNGELYLQMDENSTI